MSQVARQRIASALIAAGALGLLASLFLTWSQAGLGHNALLAFGEGRVGRGVPQHSAWQTYSVATVALAALVAALLVSAVVRRRVFRMVLALPTMAGLAFAIHAMASPPTLAEVSRVGAAWLLVFGTTAGPGETCATVALAIGLIGLGLGVRAGPAAANGSHQAVVSPAA